jgi:hypothetical protein
VGGESEMMIVSSGSKTTSFFTVKITIRAPAPESQNDSR